MRKLFGRTVGTTVFLLASCFAVSSCHHSESSGTGDQATIKMSIVWNGLSTMMPANKTDNRIAGIIGPATGVNIVPTFVNGTENENLVRIFATGKNMPDVIMAPFWGKSDACSATIKQAAKDGLIIPIDDYLNEDAPNLIDAYSTGVSPSFVTNELGAKEFDGKKYIIPMHTPAAAEDMQNWGYTVYARKDILASLGVQQSDIHSSEDVYQLALKIKNGSFKDINGNDIIPASCWANGWSYETYLNSFKTRSFTNIVNKGDHFEWTADQSYLTDEVKFMQKMVSEGLFDKTAFSQSETSALSKHVVGGIGLTSAHYPYIRQCLKTTLYASHPEMEYVPLGPINDYNGDPYMPETQREYGYYGFAVFMITKDCKHPKEFLKYLNYLNTEKGRELAYLGEEGVDWTTVDGAPRMTDAFFAAQKQNPSYAYDNGISSYFTFGCSRVPFAKFDAAMEEVPDTTYAQVKKMYPITVKKGVLASSFDNDYPQIDYLKSILDSVDFGTTIESAYCASNQEDALSILSNYRSAIKNKGYLDDYLTWLYGKIGTRDDILY